MNVSQPGSFEYFFSSCIRAPVCNIVINTIIEQDRVLRHDTHCGAQALLRDIANILAVYQNTATADVVETEQQAGQCRLAGSAVPDHCYISAGRYVEAHVKQNLAIGFIAKIHSLKANRCYPGMRSTAPVYFYLLILRQ